MSDDEPTDQEIYGELARRLCTAYTSWLARASYVVTERRLRDQGVAPGTFWLSYAKKLHEEAEEAKEAAANTPPDETPRGPVN